MREQGRKEETKQERKGEREGERERKRGRNGSESSSGRSSGSSSGSTVAHEGDSQQHARSSRPTAEATAGEAMDLDDLSTAAAAAAPPRASTHGPAAEAVTPRRSRV